MSTKYINFILIAGIAVVIASVGFFGWKMWGDQKTNDLVVEKKEFPAPTPITNKGKESEERDAALERDVRMISDAVLAYAKDHDGRYPIADIKNPCSGARSCLKGVDINTKTKRYLEAVPQIQPSKTDYHYRSDNNAKTYCVRSVVMLETAAPHVFQCTHNECGKMLISESCQ